MDQIAKEVRIPKFVKISIAHKNTSESDMKLRCCRLSVNADLLWCGAVGVKLKLKTRSDMSPRRSAANAIVRQMHSVNCSWNQINPQANKTTVYATLTSFDNVQRHCLNCRSCLKLEICRLRVLFELIGDTGRTLVECEASVVIRIFVCVFFVRHVLVLDSRGLDRPQVFQLRLQLSVAAISGAIRWCIWTWSFLSPPPPCFS